MRSLLAARAGFYVVAIPGTVALYVPYRLLRSAGLLRLPDLSVGTAAAGLLVLSGLVVLLSCVWHFAVAGRGTLATIDPPRHLVVTGLYRFTRNPMYNGVLAVLLGEAWLFSSSAVLAYSAGIFVCFHLVVVLYEERTLKSRFGDSYLRYRRAVPRWGFTVHPYSQDTGSTA
jgi:protein-S-isoprenylcysteine O-methyltransferase Ste14